MILTEKKCTMCGETYPNTIEFFPRKTIGYLSLSGMKLNCRCRKCHKIAEAGYRERRQKSYYVPHPRQSNEYGTSPNRGTLSGFKKWMLSNPVYFQERWHRENTVENIELAWRETQRLCSKTIWQNMGA